MHYIHNINPLINYKNVDENGRPYTKTSPTSGFKDELINNGQGGDVYHHILFMAGSVLAWNPILAAALVYSDMQQVVQGREESVTELRNHLKTLNSNNRLWLRKLFENYS